MPKFKVKLTRPRKEEAEVVVEAHDKNMARQHALRQMREDKVEPEWKPCDEAVGGCGSVVNISSVRKSDEAGEPDVKVPHLPPKEFVIRVGYKEYYECEANILVKAENIEEAWLIANSLEYEDLDRYDYDEVRSEPSDCEVYNVDPLHKDEEDDKLQPLKPGKWQKTFEKLRKRLGKRK